MRVEVVVVGGGVAGLWLLDGLVRRGRTAVLLEAGALGTGQTIAAQGIVHGGLKYTLDGLLSPSAAAIRDMPALWRACLDGRADPDLSRTRIRSPHCWLWRTDSLASRLGMLGARFGLRVAPQVLDAADRPAVLAGCPGTVARLDEPVLDPASLLADLAERHAGRLLRIAGEHGIAFDQGPDGHVSAVRIVRPGTGEALRIETRSVVLTAGAGNAVLRERLGLPTGAMQRRPLHMVLVRGSLPPLAGHCVDGAKTRVTITSDTDCAGRTVWQVGGQIAEETISVDAAETVRRAARELRSVLPGCGRLFDSCTASTYLVDRAEGTMPGGKRPETFRILSERNVLTAWPTKLVLAPVLAGELADRIAAAESSVVPGSRDERPASDALGPCAGWPRPEVALPPWETPRDWLPFVADETSPAADPTRVPQGRSDAA